MRLKKTLAILFLIGFAVHCSGFSNIHRYWKKLFGQKEQKKSVGKKPASQISKKPVSRYKKKKPAVPAPKAVPMQTVLVKGPLSISIESSAESMDLVMPSFEANVEATLESMFEEPQAEQKAKESDGTREFGISAGLFSGAVAINGEVRFPLQKVFGPATTSIRYLFGIAQNENSTTRYYPLQADYIFNFPAGYITGVENYIGLGLNYTLYSSGNGIGMVGWQACYGIQSEGFSGKLFCELGYGLINSGSSGTSAKGVSLLLGYRKN